MPDMTRPIRDHMPAARTTVGEYRAGAERLAQSFQNTAEDRLRMFAGIPRSTRRVAAMTSDAPRRSGSLSGQAFGFGNIGRQAVCLP